MVRSEFKLYAFPPQYRPYKVFPDGFVVGFNSTTNRIESDFVVVDATSAKEAHQIAKDKGLIND